MLQRTLARFRSTRGRIAAAAILAVAAAAAGAGCGASTQLIDAWRDPQWAGQPTRKALVASPRQDPLRQRLWEDAFVEQLRTNGVQAVPAYSLLGGAEIDSAKVAALMEDGAFDSFILVRRGAVETNTYRVPGSTTVQPSALVRDPFWGTLRQTYREVTTEGYTESETVVSYNAMLWQTDRDGKHQMSWSARTETIDPTSSSQASVEVAKAMVSGMKKADAL